MRNDPEKYSALVYHNNDKSSLSSTSRDNNSNQLDVRSRQITLPSPPYDDYIIEGYKAIILEETEKLYNILLDQLVCELINESVSKQSTGHIPSLPTLSLEGDDNKEHSEQNC
jgi:hypothetical protein